MSSTCELDEVARRIRYRLVQMSHQAGTAHLGGALSCVDLLVTLYWRILQIDSAQPDHPMRDRLIFSKGHAVSALYAVLAARGFFPSSQLDEYNRSGSNLPEQPTPGCAPGVEWATGSLGHGLGVGLGMALAAGIQRASFGTFVLMSDGECQEGSVWEAAMLAPRLTTGPLTALIDFNGWQATGRSRTIMQMEPLAEKFSAFGWDACEIDGHDFATLLSALQRPVSNQPKAIIAKTIKGRGISFIEDDNNWHYRSPTAEEVKEAYRQLISSS